MTHARHGRPGRASQRSEGQSLAPRAAARDAGAPRARLEPRRARSGSRSPRRRAVPTAAVTPRPFRASARTAGGARAAGSSGPATTSGAGRRHSRRPCRRPPRRAANHDLGAPVDLGLKGRTAIVCGASQGMGLAIAEAFAAEEMNVAMFARRRKVVAAEAERVGALAVQGDVTEPAGLRTTRREDGRGVRRRGRADQQQRRAAPRPGARGERRIARGRRRPSPRLGGPARRISACRICAKARRAA